MSTAAVTPYSPRNSGEKSVIGPFLRYTALKIQALAASFWFRVLGWSDVRQSVPSAIIISGLLFGFGLEFRAWVQGKLSEDAENPETSRNSPTSR